MLIGSSSEVVGCSVYVLSPDVPLLHLHVSDILICIGPHQACQAKTRAIYSYLYQASHDHGEVGGERPHALVDELNA